MLKKRVLVVAMALSVAVSLLSAAPAALDIMKKMETMEELNADLSAKVVITNNKPGEGTKIYHSLFFRRDADDSFLAITIRPDSEKGNGYLKVGENMWLYRKNTRTFQHINRDESINGTDVKAGDLENKKFTEQYAPLKDASGKESVVAENLGKVACWKFEVTAIKRDVTYPKLTYWVRQDNFLPLKALSYSLSGDLMTTAYYLKYVPIQGKFFMIRSIFIDEFENKGEKTIMEMSGISMAPIDPRYFTKAHLENLSN